MSMLKAPAVTEGDWMIAFSWDATGYPVYAICGISGDQKRDIATLEANSDMMAASKKLAEALAESVRVDLMRANALRVEIPQHTANAIAALKAAGYTESK